MNTSFEEVALEWDRKAGKNGVPSSQKRVKAIFDLLGSVAAKKIYEIACGNGFLCRKLVQAGAGEVWGSDIAPSLIRLAIEKYDPADIRYRVHEATDFSAYPTDYFDTVLIHQGIFYIADVEALTAGIYRILKPGGSFIFTADHPLFFSARQDLGEKVDLENENRQYLKVFPQTSTQQWKGHSIVYKSYRRPMSYYINCCGRQGLMIRMILEPRSATRIGGKIATSPIPTSLIVQVVKI